MCVLTREEILKEMEKGNIKISPFDLSQVGPGSVDLHLGDEFRVFEKTQEIFHVTDEVNYHQITKVKRVKDYIVLTPNETIHGITRERITLPPNICGWLEGRSKYARVGLMVHVTAGFIHPGIDNCQVLEILNVSNRPLAIHAGTRICQFIFERTEGTATYKGAFRHQLRL